jgi:phenylacetate-CoA ligase
MVDLIDLRQNSWSWFLKQVIFPLGDLVAGQKMMHRLSYLEKAQWWEPDRIAQIRNQSLSQLMSIAFTEVPYYRELIEQTGVRAKEFRTPGDLKKIPVSNKDSLRSNYPERVVRPTGHKTYEASTSGSTGKNFFVREDAETAGRYRACFLLALEWAGWRFGEPQVQTGMTLQRSLDRKFKDLLLKCHYTSAFDLTDPNLDSTLDLIEKYRIKHLWGYPGSLYFLAQRALQKGWNRPLRSIVTWGDNLFPQYRRTIETAFQTQICDTYGCAEGVQISAQCEYGRYHVHDLDTIIEFLDDEFSPVLPDQVGNIVITRLHPGPMPLIRYRIGDLGVAGKHQTCECGRGFSLMESIQGRDTDIVLTPGGNRLIVHFFTGILEYFPEINNFQVVQEDLVTLTLRVVPANGYSQSTAKRIITRLKEKGANDLEINVEEVTEIPLSSGGKRRFVISHVS